MTEEEPMIWVCRDVPGEHTGGPECFCHPLPFTPDQSVEEIMAEMEKAQRRQ